MQTLVQFMGGKDEFERRLDYIFTPGTGEQDLGVNGLGIDTIMNIGYALISPLLGIHRDDAVS